MDGDVHPSVQQSGVQLLDKQSLAADFVQRAVEDLVPGGLHGDKLGLHLRVAAANLLDHHFRLDHGKAAFPAADTYLFHSNSSNTARTLRAATAVFLCSSPCETTPHTSPLPVQMAGKKKVLSSFRSATLTKIPAALASCQT